ncbi:hypothetical protein O7621_06325 [Solwaraspora sp. WMMD937]|uniref:hypothetical protein n=1 Tax=Solwaraspora sp. WMMD937 TaxID=3016090 RepID=UPI00249BDD1A|nr:hypothetical protein [Solwaraspora sp. WMMD937]WFE22939.1 hypothetical protein O7621_06325 [Solwaraspora sp. WMMD937]
MRRFTYLAVATATAVLLAAVPASAALDNGRPPSGDDDWVPVPSAPFEQEAGITCDFPIRGEPVLDRVVKMVLATYPDGSSKREIYTGALIYRITNTSTGESVEVDISGTSVLNIRPGGSYSNNVTWRVWGPILLGMHGGKGNYPRGMYVPNGIYTVDVSKSGYRTLRFTVGSAHNICDDLQP